MYQLQQSTDKLALVHTTNTKIKPIYVDFCSKKIKYRCSASNLAQETIIKTIGNKKHKPNLSIIDATAGFGYDSFILAAAGYNVIMVERSHIMATLLKDGLNRAKTCPQTLKIIDNMQLIEDDAKSFLRKLSKQQYPDLIYLDPMFPEKPKEALAKKEMQALQLILGEDLDCNELLTIALNIAKERVIVKRPRLAPSIEAKNKPSFSLKGTACRFDVYLRS